MYGEIGYGENGFPEGLHANEMLRCDIYEVPRKFWDESAFRISAAYLCCPCCGRVGEDMESIPHEDDCPFAENLPAIP